METLAVLLLSILTLLTLITGFLFLRGLFPGRISAVQIALKSSWKRSFWLGLVNTVFSAAVLLGLFSLGESAQAFMILALLLSSLYLLVLLFGLTAISRLLGQRLFPDRKPVPQHIRGGLILLGAGLLPGIGWFLLFPYSCCLAVGSVVLARFQPVETADFPDPRPDKESD
jgi:hypothetical protein